MILLEKYGLRGQTVSKATVCYKKIYNLQDVENDQLEVSIQQSCVKSEQPLLQTVRCNESTAPVCLSAFTADDEILIVPLGFVT